MEWKKRNIFEFHNEAKFLYDEDYGVGKIDYESITFILSENKELPANSIYIKDNNGNFNRLSNSDILVYLKNESWEGSTVYILKPHISYRYNVYKEDVEKTKINAVRIKLDKIFFLSYEPSYRNYSYKTVSTELEFKSKSEILEYKFLSNENFEWNDLKKPLISDIKVGKKFYIPGQGTIEVLEIYDKISKNGTVCKVKGGNESIFELPYNEDNLYFLPFEKTLESNLNQLNENINEKTLQPYVAHEGNTYNVYWKKIDDPIEYRVRMYKIITINNRDDLYHLKDFSVPRNESFLSIDGLVGGSYVFKVIAENREGEIIAESRGISKGLPKFFGKTKSEEND